MRSPLLNDDSIEVSKWVDIAVTGQDQLDRRAVLEVGANGKREAQRKPF